MEQFLSKIGINSNNTSTVDFCHRLYEIKNARSIKDFTVSSEAKLIKTDEEVRNLLRENYNSNYTAQQNIMMACQKNYFPPNTECVLEGFHFSILDDSKPVFPGGNDTAPLPDGRLDRDFVRVPMPVVIPPHVTLLNCLLYGGYMFYHQGNIEALHGAHAIQY